MDWIKNKTTWIVVAICALLLVGMAVYSKSHAADKGGPQVANIFNDAPVGPSRYNWTGCYGGGSLKKGSLSTDVGFGVDGYGLGLVAGCDVQLGQIVLGLGGDYDWDHVTQFGGISATEWSLFGRAGVVVSNATMIYALVSRPTLNVNSVGIANTTGIGVGGGIETMLTQYMAVAMEYRHNDWSNLAGGGVNPREDTVGVRLTARLNLFSGK